MGRPGLVRRLSDIAMVEFGGAGVNLNEVTRGLGRVENRPIMATRWFDEKAISPVKEVGGSKVFKFRWDLCLSGWGCDLSW
jgi:hypothetical protein